MSETVDNHLSVVNSCISNNAISFNIAYENNECVVSYNKYMKKSDINSKENDADFDQNKALNMKILYLKVLYLHDYLNSLCNVDSCDIYNTDQVRLLLRAVVSMQYVFIQCSSVCLVYIYAPSGVEKHDKIYTFITNETN